MSKAKLKTIKPKKHVNDGIVKQLHQCCDIMKQSNSPIVGYVFISIHKDKSFHTYYDVNKAHIETIDLPDMVKSRLQARIIQSMGKNDAA